MDNRNVITTFTVTLRGKKNKNVITREASFPFRVCNKLNIQPGDTLVLELIQIIKSSEVNEG